GTQDVPKSVISFVTRILEDLLGRILREVHGKRPRPGPGVRVIECHSPFNSMRTGWPKPFDHPQVLTRTTVAGLVGEVRGFDHQRSTVPMRARVSHVQANVLADVRTPVERDHPRLVNHLVTDGDVSGSLHNLI